MKKDKYNHLKLFHFSQKIREDVKSIQRCLVFGNFGAMNYGDEAILAGELQELKKLKKLEVWVTSRFPGEIKKMHKINALSLFDPLRIVIKTAQADFIIIGGGGMIARNDNGLQSFLYQLYTWSLFLLIPLMLQKHIYVLGIGIYDNAHPFILNVTTKMLKHVDIVTVRDHHSLDVLQKYNVKGSLYKDNSYLMELPSKKDVMKESFFAKQRNKKKIQVGITLKKPQSIDDAEKIKDVIADFVVKNADIADFWFYPVEYHTSYDNDKKFGESIKAKIDKKSNGSAGLHIVPTIYSPKTFFGSFQLMDFFISERFHSSLFCYRNKVDFVGISYDRKCTSLLQAIGVEGIQRSSNLTGAYLQKRLQTRYINL